MTFSFYDQTIAALEKEMENRMLVQLNNYYEKQFELMKTSINTSRSVRHDMLNHLSMIQILLQKGEYKQLDSHLLALLQKLDKRKEYVTSGNIMIDSILNFKLQDAEYKCIKTQIDINVPETLSIKSFDLTVILGNLLDNAINAVSKLEKEERIIDIHMKYSKSILMLQINNRYDGIVDNKGDKLITSNKDKANHGIGLMNVVHTLEKYHGKLEMEYSKEEFRVTALMYMAKEE
jgi:sensor histidine kinase regulating citrate/malate metabolism